MRRRTVAALWAGLAAAWASAAAVHAEAPPEPSVILISLDGVRHDYPDRWPLPALTRLEDEGLRAGRLEPVAPASTFPTHVSLATGAPPAVHGILDNRFFDPERGEFDYSNDASWIQAEPLWVAAERQGVPAATFFWVGSDSDWRGRGARHRRAPFDSRVGEAEKVEQILDWLDLPEGERPRLVMSWWHGTDRAGHRLGPEHAGVGEALAEQDRHLGALLAGLDARNAWPHTTLLVVSDHGMTGAARAVPLRARLREAGLRPRVVVGSAVAHLFFEDPDEIAIADRALSDLPGSRLDRREDLGGSGLAHPTRSGDLVARALPGFSFRPRRFRDTVARLFGRGRGVHGYAVPHRDMAGIFFASGRCVPAGTRPEAVDSLDIAATAAALLGIDSPSQSRGRPLEPLEPSPCTSSSISTAR